MERNRRHGARFLFNLDAFFGLYGLMKTITPAPAKHQPAGKLVDNDYLTVFDNIVTIFKVKRPGFKGIFNVVDRFKIFFVKVVYA